MLEKYLIEQCAPTLASLKTANLFSIAFAAEENLEKQMEFWNANLGGKGISLQVLLKRQGRVLVYVCRMAKLQEDLHRPGVQQFLTEYGYVQDNVEDAVRKLQQRLATQEEFPHEIGLFLGYPLGDVVGFIQNAGQNCKCSGCWKVYSNECEAVKLFARYQKCTDVYKRLWKQGRRSVWQLTVAA